MREPIPGDHGGHRSQPSVAVLDDVPADVEIVPDNIRALASLYQTAMLEEMKLFATIDKVVEHFWMGVLPISRSDAGDALYRYHRDAPQRLSEGDRRSLYGRTLGIAIGSIDEPKRNHEFAERWARCLAAISRYGHDGARAPVLEAALALAHNGSSHGFGIAHFAAVELGDTVRRILRVLSSAEILAAYGVSSLWQLVERISQQYLGGAADGPRYRTMADAGLHVLRWLGDNALRLVDAPDAVTIDDGLVKAVERWLAASGASSDASRS